MGNILLNLRKPQPSSNNSVTNLINNIRANGPSDALYNDLYKNNPSFKNFANSLQGLTPEQAFSKYGLNFNQFNHLKW